MSGAPRSERDRGYETLEHTADLGLRVWAPDLEGLFAEGARGLVSVMGEAEGPSVHQERIALEAPDLEALYVDWLSEVLFLFEARGVVPRTVEARISERPWRVDGIVEGPDAASFREEGPAVKAVTYHGLSVRRTSAGWEARVYLDV